MFRYDDDGDYYDRPDPVLTRGCTCWAGSLEEPCRYCQGEYPCEGECGSLSYDCQCEPSWDELPNETQRELIYEAFRYLCELGLVPNSVQNGDDDTWDQYAPAIEYAEERYNEAVNA